MPLTPSPSESRHLSVAASSDLEDVASFYCQLGGGEGLVRAQPSGHGNPMHQARALPVTNGKNSQMVKEPGHPELHGPAFPAFYLCSVPLNTLD